MHITTKLAIDTNWTEFKFFFSENITNDSMHEFSWLIREKCKWADKLIHKLHENNASQAILIAMESFTFIKWKIFELSCGHVAGLCECFMPFYYLFLFLLKQNVANIKFDIICACVSVISIILTELISTVLTSYDSQIYMTKPIIIKSLTLVENFLSLAANFCWYDVLILFSRPPSPLPLYSVQKNWYWTTAMVYFMAIIDLTMTLPIVFICCLAITI